MIKIQGTRRATSSTARACWPSRAWVDAMRRPWGASRSWSAPAIHVLSKCVCVRPLRVLSFVYLAGGAILRGPTAHDRVRPGSTSCCFLCSGEKRSFCSHPAWWRRGSTSAVSPRTPLSLKQSFSSACNDRFLRVSARRRSHKKLWFERCDVTPYVRAWVWQLTKHRIEMWRKKWK